MSLQNKKNVIVVVVDSLTYKRLGVAGQRPSPSPVIDSLASSSLSLTNCFAAGCPTDFSLPSLMTSSLPLDFGGCTYGLKNRPKALAEVFKENNYHTVFFKCNELPEHWGYHRGYQEVYGFFDISIFHLDIILYTRFYRNLYRLADGSCKKYLQDCAEYLAVTLSDIHSYCKDMEAFLKDGVMTPSLMMHDHNFSLMDQLVQEELNKLKVDPEKYVRDIWASVESSNAGLDQIFSLVASQTKNAKTARVDKYAKILLALTYCQTYLSSLLKRVSKHVRWDCFSRLKGGQDVSVRYPSTGYLVDNLLSWIKEKGERPFFVWLQPMDVHELNFTSFDAKNAEDRVRDEVKSSLRFYRKSLMNYNKYRGSLMYDYSISYVDHQLGRLVDSLKRQDLWNNTIVLITSDHGHTHVGWPIRTKSHVATHFFDELYHIPVIFTGGGIEHKNIDELCSSIDITPTLLGLAGIDSPPVFKGSNLNEKSNTPREYIMMEHMGKGLCDFGLKPIFVCIRNQTHKLVYMQPSPKEKQKGYIREFYDLVKDPNESENLVPVIGDLKEVNRMKNIAQQRIKQIYDENGKSF